MSWVHIESTAYYAVLIAAALAIGFWQTLRPARKLRVAKERRWANHSILMLAGSGSSILLFRTGAVMTAVAAAHSRYGLLHRDWLPVPAQFIAAVLLLDLARYGFHLLNHSAPLLWRVHRVHHSDPDCDLSTGFRAHPIETVLWQGGYLAWIAILAPPPAIVLAVELTSLFQSFLSHANASLPEWMERPLRYVFVTPQMHAIHHSEEVRDQAANLGDIFSCWDRLFGTYLPEPAAGHERLVTGIKGLQNDRSLDVSFMLMEPFERLRSTPELPTQPTKSAV